MLNLALNILAFNHSVEEYTFYFLNKVKNVLNILNIKMLFSKIEDVDIIKKLFIQANQKIQLNWNLIENKKNVAEMFAYFESNDIPVFE